MEIASRLENEANVEVPSLYLKEAMILVVEGKKETFPVLKGKQCSILTSLKTWDYGLTDFD